ncbi:hypothetical protein SAMN05428988_6055 [Chitinophaga sp. YR573]|uniref:alpha-L-rhamnosidase-related protein n=1 Tax=Chitinophaga sp. YR573 TaxID=1881040 RepID=UPI0008B62D95|nr:hypothetical protein [Chitinophaga sp. YR573]SEW45521.1 hypothetical protein SAMN05428988_6055 [Chitinophaga sp. YR573]
MKKWFLLLIMFPVLCLAQPVIKNDILNRQILFGNEKMQMTLDYNKKAIISSLVLNGQQVLDPAGIYSFIKTDKKTYSTLQLSSYPLVQLRDNVITCNIQYGDKIFETWKFTVTAKDIKFDIDRKMSNNITAEEVGLPLFMFKSINTWEGAYQGYGGLAWFYLFNKSSDTYGVHSNSSDFWNSKTNNGLSVIVNEPGAIMSYSRVDDKLSYSIALSAGRLRYDSGTNRRRYIRDRTDVWAPVNVGSGHKSITLSYFNFNDKYGRGKFVGINGDQVSAVLNTIARIGVIDKEHFGGNSWHTPYGPICLHEQYIAQMGLAINDQKYLNGYQQCLDYYRDNAIKPDGRVWSRWAYTNEDMMPGEVTDKGFYEAQWGYLLDANPDFVANVAELYDQTGDKAWVKTHQLSCEKALDWLLKRDTNNNGLVEMINDNHTEKKSSDWIDIIWASYENAFVNAKLYHALTLWADIEQQLGNTEKAYYYQQFAAKLKASFNKPVSEGGFWDGNKSCYIHWRDKDGSVHGNNMVTPVNFMAIGYGICDNKLRTKTILDTIEYQMQKEQLFFWPICMYSYNKGEGNDWQFPFPNYENGDLFLSWGALGVKAYASYKPELALKYVKNVLAQYAKDGLAFQRYGRVNQDGLGDDILSGNSLSVVGLYQAIYGINPLYNRFYLNPHITQQLSGTQLKYNFRGQVLLIDLAMNKYAISDGRFKIVSERDFGFYGSDNELLYFNGNNGTASMKVETTGTLALEIKNFSQDNMLWSQSSTGLNKYLINDLKGDNYYTISVNKQILKRMKSTADGSITFDYKTSKITDVIAIENK